MVQSAGNGFYHEDTPPTFEWDDDNNSLWYEERPRMILHFYRKGTPKWRTSDDIRVFVNMEFKPTTEAIDTFIHRGLKAAGVEYAGIENLRLNNWSGTTNAYWHANLVSVTAREG